MHTRLQKYIVVFTLGSLSVLSPLTSQDDKPQLGTATKDGLSLAISLEKKLYRETDDITLAFKLRNETKNDLYIGDGYFGPNYQEVGPGRHFELYLKDEQGTQYRFWSGAATEGGTAGIRKIFRLKPGDSYDGFIYILVSSEKVIEFADFPNRIRGGSLASVATDRKHALGKDGHRYSVSLLYQVNPRSHGVWQPPQGFQDELLWKGSMEATPLHFTIEPPDK